MQVILFERRKKTNWNSFLWLLFNCSSGVGNLDAVITMPEEALLGRQKESESVAAVMVVVVVEMWGICQTRVFIQKHKKLRNEVKTPLQASE